MSENFDINNELDAELNKLFEVIENLNFNPEDIDDQDAIVPTYAYDLDSGFDFYSVGEINIPPLGRVLVPTGLAFEVPDGTELQVRSKSGLAINQGLMVLNSPGTVDCGYHGEIKVIVMNMNNHPVVIKKNQKVAQGVLCPVFNGKKVKLVEKNNLGKSDRGENGFGSTGI